MENTYEAPEIFELGAAEEMTLGCTCSSCDCCCGKLSSGSEIEIAAA